MNPLALLASSCGLALMLAACVVVWALCKAPGRPTPTPLTDATPAESTAAESTAAESTAAESEVDR